MMRREKLKLARLERRLRRKEQNRRKLKKQKSKRKKDSCSIDSEKLNCFTHNNDHWKTAPLWTGKLSFICF
jgi:extracellular sulfatase Sulf